MTMAIITSPENHRNLAKYRDIAVRLARAEGITEDEAHRLANQGKAVVWEDGGLHATEILNSQTLFWTAYQFVSQNDPETLRILNDCILLLTPVNPDGLELTANWYMREPDPLKRNMQLPRLYHKYVGHDNNRDSFMANQLETQAINRQLYVEWMPQIVYNAHQTGPQGAILFTPPFRDPFNYNYDPLVPIGIDMVERGHHASIPDGGEGRLGVPHRIFLFDLVERHGAEHHLLPQPDRHSHRDQRQPDADGDWIGARSAVAACRCAAAYSAAKGLALQAVDRLHPVRAAGDPRSWRRGTRTCSCSACGGWA